MKIKDKIWILALLAGFLFTYGVLGVPTGIGSFLFFNTILAILYFIVHDTDVDKDLPKNMHSEWVIRIFMGFYVLLTVTYLYRLDAMVTYAVALYHIGFLALYSVFGFFPALIQTVNPFSGFIYWIGLGINWVVSIFKSAIGMFQMSSSKVRYMMKIVVYISASLIVFIVFATLLSQADPNFRERILRILETIKFGELVIRTFAGVIMLFIFAGLFKLLAETPILNVIGLRKEVMTGHFEKLKTFIHTKDSDAYLPLLITLPIVGIFALFVYLQFKYLFALNINDILGSFTISQYAQKGFVELLVVVGLTYPVVAWVTNFSRSKAPLPRMLNFVVNTVIVVCVYVMLYSALTRMGIYTDSYGPSVKRNYVMLGISVLGIGMLGYELLAIWKAFKPEKSLINSLFIGDFIVWAGILCVMLLSAVALFPWNNATFAQIKNYYDQTGKLDVYQITSLSTEATRDVYLFADQLEQKYADKINGGSCLNDITCPSAGIGILKLSTLSEKEAYLKEVKQSIFTRVFGFNITGILLETLNTPDYAQYSKDKSFSLQAEYKTIAGRFVDAIQRNDFDKARTFYDPKMVANDLASLRQGVRISIKPSSTGYSMISSFTDYSMNTSRYFSKYEMFYYEVEITRPNSVTLNQQVVRQQIISKPIMNDTLSVRVGLRNGKAVVVYSDFVLGYLPDAIFSEENRYSENASNLSTYGYEVYCGIPNAELLFRTNVTEKDCNVGFGVSDLRVADFNLKK